MTKNVILCDCLGSQKLDAEGIEGAIGRPCSAVHTELCGRDAPVVNKALAAGEVLIACQQEARRFAEMAEDLGLPSPAFVDLRDRAGWSDEGENATPKMAALVAEAMVPQPSVKSLDVVSHGACLIIGSADVAVSAAEILSETLAVTVLLTEWDGMMPTGDCDIVVGRLAKITGTLGRFDVAIDRFQTPVAGGRGVGSLTIPRDGAVSQCDVILDLSGNAPLFPAWEKRDGYVRADPASQTAMTKAILSASQMLGTFEKPLHIKMEPQLCAHSRAQKTACSNCLDICPTGAISPNGEHVTVDPLICAGCAACASLCPSGAISYDTPTVDVLFQRLSTLARTYRKAGGKDPVLLVHDEDHGAEMIRLSARFGRGLPAHVIPLSVSALAGFGHAEMLAGLGVGFAHVAVLLGPGSERGVIEQQAELANALAGSTGVSLLDLEDPDALSAILYNQPRERAPKDTILPLGSRRQLARLAAKSLNESADPVALPPGAPYGAVLVDTDACTLCLSCVSLCPSGALVDNDDLPQLRFQEDACLQCGLCSKICPEQAITLAPRMDLSDAALSQRVLHEEEPFACIECGSQFGVRSTVERIVEKLAGNHAMYVNPDAARMIQMCESCRIQAQFHSTDNPLAGGERPRVRTSEDYFSARKDH